VHREKAQRKAKVFKSVVLQMLSTTTNSKEPFISDNNSKTMDLLHSQNNCEGCLIPKGEKYHRNPTGCWHPGHPWPVRISSVYNRSNPKDLNAPLQAFVGSKSSVIAEGREVTQAPLRKAGLWQNVSWSLVKSRGYASTNIAQRSRSYVNNIKGEAQYRCRYHDIG